MTHASERFFNASGDLLCITGFDGALKEQNHAFSSLLGYAPGELSSAPFINLLHTDDREAAQAEIDRARGGGRTSFASRIQCKDGTYKNLHWSGTPSPEDQVIYFVARYMATPMLKQDLSSPGGFQTADAASDSFFDMLVRHLSAVLRVKHAFVAQCVDWPVTRVSTLAGWMFGKPSENFEYPLAGTPCEKVLLGECCYFPSGVQEAFADDKFLIDTGCQSYLGAPLIDSVGTLLGHICVLDDKPMSPEDREWQTDVIRTFAGWAVAELDRARTEESFRKVMEATASLSGVDFIKSLAKNIAGALDVRYALITEYIDEPPTRARALAFWSGDGFIEGYEYRLAGTPCAVAAEGGVCHFEDRLQERFPEDPDLVSGKIQSYLSIPLHGASGKQIGQLIAMDTRPMPARSRRTRLLHLFAVRTATEIERERAEELMRRAMRAMSTPIIQAWDGVIAMPVIGSVDRDRAAQMMETLLNSIAQTRAGFAILDLTGVKSVDISTASHLLGMVRAAALLGSRCLISGISPEIARTMVELGIEGGALSTFGTLQSALKHAIRAQSSRTAGATRA